MLSSSKLLRATELSEQIRIGGDAFYRSLSFAYLILLS